MGELATNPEALLTAVGVVLLGGLAVIWRLVQLLAGTKVGKHVIKGLVEDLDDERKPKPDSDGALLVQAIASTTAHATVEELRPELNELHTQLAAVRDEQDAAEVREQQRSRRIDATESRLARIEGHLLGLKGPPLEGEDAPAPGRGTRR
jgi:hypothetical protein